MMIFFSKTYQKPVKHKLGQNLIISLIRILQIFWVEGRYENKNESDISVE